MLSKEDFVKIQALAERGVYQKDIAAELGVHPKTVRRALKRGAAPKRERPARGSKLAAFHTTVDRLLSEDVWNAAVILRAIQAEGYTGGATVLREYIAPKRALRAGRATVRFETEPGRQLQSDWGQIQTVIAGELVRVDFIVNQLGYSRRFHFWCTDSQDAEHTYEGLIRAFEHFGGAPAQVLVDNQKAAVYAHRAGQAPQFNERFVDLAGHYGFTPRACQPYRARTKGKIERVVGYLKAHFFVRYRAFDSWEHLNQTAEAWLAQEADPRVHGTTGEVVAERFIAEAAKLRPLPPTRYDTAYRLTRQVSWDGYVDVHGRRFSVPHTQAGRTVAVRLALDGTLTVLDGEQVVATHRLDAGTTGWVTVPEHHAALWQQTLGVEQRDLAVYEELAAWS
jgi:transposase